MANFLLKEDGSYLLLETGDKILLEDKPSASASLSPSSSSSASLSPSASASKSASKSSSASASASPSIGFEDYTRQQVLTLPSNNNDLSTIYSASEIEEISYFDAGAVGQVGDQKYMIHQFKVFTGDIDDDPTIVYKGYSTLAPNLSTVYLQIYNQLRGWETIDSNNISQENIVFTLEKTIPDLTNYRDLADIISCRVYQLAI